METRDRDHGFGQSGLLLMHRLLDLDYGRTDLSLDERSVDAQVCE